MKPTTKICIYSILSPFFIITLYFYTVSLSSFIFSYQDQNQKLCKNNPVHIDCNTTATDRISLLILISAGQGGSIHRSLQRNGPMKHVWLDCTGRPISVIWKFTVTKPKDTGQYQFDHVMYAESREHHDVFMSYYWLSDKRLVHLEEALRGFNFDYIIKIKENTLVNPSMLYNHLLSLPHQFYGGVINEGNVIASKKFDQNLQPVESDMIQFVDASFMILSRSVVQNILSIAHHIPFVDHESAYIGMLANKLRIAPTKLELGFTKDLFDKGCVNGYSSYFTGLDDDELEGAFDKWVQCGTYC